MVGMQRSVALHSSMRERIACQNRMIDDIREAVAEAAQEGRAYLNIQEVSELLVDAMIQVESAGDPTCVGLAGERGLMQIKYGTWELMTPRALGARVDFDQAFDPETNRRVGKAYLAFLQDFLLEHRCYWQDDERTLLLACYNAGPQAVARAGFNFDNLPKSTRSYVDRIEALHDFYLAERAPLLRSMLIASKRRMADIDS
jgi:soluble lytic murein transglycosylase-like protein